MRYLVFPYVQYLAVSGKEERSSDRLTYMQQLTVTQEQDYLCQDVWLSD